jgi:hypothetical protein
VAGCGTFVNCPIFLPEDDTKTGNWPVLAEKVSIWMEQGKQAAVGGHRQVLEDGPDVCNSESDSDHSDHGEEWADSNMYTAEMPGPDVKKISRPQVLSQLQAMVLRAAGRAKPSSESEPSCTSTTSGADGEDSVDEWYANHPEEPKCGDLVSSRLPTPIGTPVHWDNEDGELSEDQKRCIALGKRMAERSGRAGGQAIRGKSCSNQMAAGSGSTDTRVIGGHPSKTSVVLFCLCGGFQQSI